MFSRVVYVQPRLDKDWGRFNNDWKIYDAIIHYCEINSDGVIRHASTKLRDYYGWWEKLEFQDRGALNLFKLCFSDELVILEDKNLWTYLGDFLWRIV